MVPVPDGTAHTWRSYWDGTTLPAGDPREGPVVRTVHQCLLAVLWTGPMGLTPLNHELPKGLTAVPFTGIAPSRFVVTWHDTAAATDHSSSRSSGSRQPRTARRIERVTSYQPSRWRQ